MKEKIKKLTFIIKSCLLLVAIMVVVGATGEMETKVSHSNQNLFVDLTMMAAKVNEDKENDIYSAKETYFGDLTGYGPLCPLCSGRLACMPSLDVIHGNINYNDATYGDLRIVASSKKLACGSVVRIYTRLTTEPMLAIVLDRGVLGTDLDLLMQSEEDASKYVGREKLSYDVIRRGW